LPYSFSPATTATVFVLLAPAGDDEPHPALTSTAVSPIIPTATFANLNIVLRLSVIVGLADMVRTDPSAKYGRLQRPQELVWIGCK
jgi:hypothetical protein